jgi:hypothetical protein
MAYSSTRFSTSGLYSSGRAVSPRTRRLLSPYSQCQRETLFRSPARGLIAIGRPILDSAPTCNRPSWPTTTAFLFRIKLIFLPTSHNRRPDTSYILGPVRPLIPAINRQGLSKLLNSAGRLTVRPFWLWKPLWVPCQPIRAVHGGVLALNLTCLSIAETLLTVLERTNHGRTPPFGKQHRPTPAQVTRPTTIPG